MYLQLLPIELRAHIAAFDLRAATLMYEFDREFHEYIIKNALLITTIARAHCETVLHNNKIFTMIFGWLHSINGEPAIISGDAREYWARGRIYKKIAGGTEYVFT